LRKELRNHATEAEKALWDMLKHAKLDGRKFRRQHSVGNYILDFYCPAEQLSIELDGEGHYTEEGKAYDAVRTAYLASCNIRELRFENQLVLNEPDEVIATIRASLQL
jgi:very-short-patch-repair endonuclease